MVRQGYTPFISEAMSHKRAAPCDIQRTLQKQNYLNPIILQAAFCHVSSDFQLCKGRAGPAASPFVEADS